MKRIIWAVNPYESGAGSLEGEARLLRRWFPNASIEPVFVVTPAIATLPAGWFKEAIPRLKSEASGKFRELRSRLADLKVPEPAILTQFSDHVENVARALNEHAVARRADLLVVRSNPHRGLRQLILGSVTKALLEAPSTPLLILTETHLAQADAVVATFGQARDTKRRQEHVSSETLSEAA